MKHHLLGQYVWWLPRLCILCASLWLTIMLFRNTLSDPHARDYREDAVHRNYLETFIREGIITYNDKARKVVVNPDIFMAWFEGKSQLGADVTLVRAELEGAERDKKSREARQKLLDRGILKEDEKGGFVIDEEQYRKKAAQYPSGHYFQLAQKNIDRFKLTSDGIIWDSFYLREPNTFPIDPLIPRGRFFDRNGEQLTRWNEGHSEADPENRGLYHVLGSQNRSGLERHLQQRLEGIPDRGIHDLVGLKGNHHRGQDLLLSVRRDVSKTIYQAFEENDLKGAAVVLDVKTGRIVAAVSAPEPQYDMSLGALMGDKNKPLLNRAWDQLYFPGSTFKPVVAAAQLEHPDMEDEDLKIKTNPNRRVKDRAAFMRIRNHRGTVSPIELNMERALAASSNTYFAGQGVVLGAHLPELTRRFGFYSSMDLLSNVTETRVFSTAKPTGYPKNIPYKRGNYPLYAQYAIGQNAIKSHPLHMASLAQIIANNGVAITPTLAAGWREGNRVRDTGENRGKFQPFPLPEERRILDVDVAKQLQKALKRGPNTKWGTGFRAPQVYKMEDERGVRYETAKRKDAPKGGTLIEMSGKTGTAQDGKRKPHAWFMGFAPAENPRFAVAVVVENVGTGAEFAIPIAAKALAASLQDYQPVQDPERVN